MNLRINVTFALSHNDCCHEKEEMLPFYFCWLICSCQQYTVKLLIFAL